MSRARFDSIVIGAGISGLVDAILLAEVGQKVLVLEQHTIAGGYLQQFKRKETVFDVGFHYMGSTDQGKPMRQFLEHLEIWDQLEMLPFPTDRAIEVRQGSRRFGYPNRWEAFRQKAISTWPNEALALESYCDAVDALCAKFRWFHLRRDVKYEHPLDMDLPTHALSEELERRFVDPWLREVLAVQSFNLGLHSHEIPWSKHALAFRSNFDTTMRVRGGGARLTDQLMRRGRELGVEYRFRQDVCGFDCEGRRVKAVTSKSGERIEADLFVAACHPKPILRCFDDVDLKPMYKERVLELRDSRGALQVFLRLAKPATSFAGSCVMLTDTSLREGSPALDTLLIVDPSNLEPDSAPRLEVMTYLDAAPFAKWKDTSLMRRGTEYETFKQELSDRVVRAVTTIAPEISDTILDVYAATPLTDQSYTRNENGGVFGISHDISQQGANRPMPRVRMKNLYFTGHSMTMPGICGTFINAFDTCSMLRDDDLFGCVAT